MKKRILTFLLIVAFVYSLVPYTYAESEGDLKEKASTLYALGILTLSQADSSNGNNTITRQAFVTAVYNMLTDNASQGDILQMAKGYGLIVSDNPAEFEGDKPITLDQAVKITTCALGYETMAQNEGGYPNGYFKAANSIKLLAGVGGSQGAPLKMDPVIRLLYNAIHADAARVLSYGDGKTENFVKSGQTVLSLNRNIYRKYGIVEGGVLTTLSASKGLGKDNVKIDGVLYEAGSSSAGEYLGKYVSFYYQEKELDPKGKILHIVERSDRNSELIFDGEDVLSLSDDYSQLTYTNEDEKHIKLDISPVVKVIYNGKAYSGYTKEDFSPVSGNVRLVDNDGDNVYDVVFINSYEVMVVNYVSLSDKTAYSKYSYSGAMKSVDIDTATTEYDCIISKNGQQISSDAVLEWDVLNVAVSKSEGKKLINIILTRQAIEGKLDSINEYDGEVTVNSKNYKLTEAYKNATAAKDPLGQNLLLGKEYKLYLDKEQKIAAVYNDITELDYALILKLAMENGVDNTIKARFMNMDEEWITADFQKTVLFNNKSVSAKEVYDTLKHAVDKEAQMVTLKLNSNGLIKSINNAVTTSSVDKDILTCSEEAILMYFYQSQTFASKVYLDKGARIVFIPDSHSIDELDYSVSNAGSLIGDKDYQFRAYNMDRFNFTKLIVVKQTKQEKLDSVSGVSIFVVDKINTVITSTGETMPKLYGNMGVYENLSVTGETTDVFNGVEQGDIIFIHTNAKGRADSISKAFSISIAPGKMDSPTFHAKSVIAAGNVININPSDGKIKIDTGSERNFRVETSIPVIMYDVKRKTIENVSINEIKSDDYVVLRISWSNIMEIMLVRF